MNEFFTWLERSGLGEAVRSTYFLYPALESLHILGLAALVGPALAFDLRLLGVGRRFLPVTTAARHLLPLSHLGLAVAVLSGLAMFTANAVTIGASAAAVWKLALLVLAGINIAVFHFGVYRTVSTWNLDVRPPWPARTAAGVSAAAWTGVILAGRLLAYT